MCFKKFTLAHTFYLHYQQKVNTTFALYEVGLGETFRNNRNPVRDKEILIKHQFFIYKKSILD